VANDLKSGPGRVPARRFFGQSLQTTLGSLLVQVSRHNELLDAEGYTGRRVLGYKLPEWQRPAVWTDTQCIRFLESCYLGVGIGSFMVNFSIMKNDAVHLVLLDGQQRLRAIERYWNGELAVEGGDGIAYRWPDLTENEQAHFLRISFPWQMTEYESDAEVREAYDRHNFGGVAHTPDQRASCAPMEP
jgi:hypothetical protein